MSSPAAIAPEPEGPNAARCLECGSYFDLASRELVKSSGMRDRLRQAEEDRETWRKKALELEQQMSALASEVAALQSERDTVIGQLQRREAEPEERRFTVRGRHE